MSKPRRPTTAKELVKRIEDITELNGLFNNKVNEDIILPRHLVVEVVAFLKGIK